MKPPERRRKRTTYTPAQLGAQLLVELEKDVNQCLTREGRLKLSVNLELTKDTNQNKVSESLFTNLKLTQTQVKSVF